MTPEIEAGESQQTAPPSDGSEQRRVAALDGLRGVAALGVVLNHVARASLVWYNPPGGPRPPISAWLWWFTETPLHVLWAGPEMVILFFVLSGFVLVLPARSSGGSWFSWWYYPRRLLRLYLPAWGAIVFAGVLNLARPEHPITGASPWLNSFTVHPALSTGLQSASLTAWPGGAVPAGFTTVLWSMRWEVAFSMLLPLMVVPVLITRSRPRVALLGAAGCFAAFYFVPNVNDWANSLHWLVIFELGSLLAFHAHRLPTISRSTWPIAALCFAACVTLVTATYWWLSDDVSSSSGWPELAVLVGAVLAVWLAHASATADAVLSTRPARWLGGRSYSLYLVHQPIVIMIAFGLGGHMTVLELLLVAVPASLIAADLFWRWIERPVIALSRRVGRGMIRPASSLA